MGSTNIGGQKVTYHFHFPLRAKDLNRMYYKSFPVGCYDGLELVKIDDTSVKITPGVLLIEANNDKVTVGVETTDYAVVQNVSYTYRRIIARYEWKEPSNPDDRTQVEEAEKWYCDFLAIAPGTELPTDVILGDAIYSGLTLSGFDYSYRTTSRFSIFDVFRGKLDHWSDLGSYLQNNTIGSMFMVIDPSDDPHNFLTYPTFYMAIKQSGTNIDDVWKPLAISAGVQMFWSGSTSNIPQDYMICNGTEISRTIYNKLFDAIGTIHGAGNGSTTFNIPNMLDKFVRCENVSGNTGGSDDAVVVEHTHSCQSAGDHTHTASGGNHGHTAINGGSHRHYYYRVHDTTPRGGGSHYLANNVYNWRNTSNQSPRDHHHTVGSTGSGHSHNVSTDGDHSHTIDNTGIDGTDKNIPSYLSLIPIIKVK